MTSKETAAEQILAKHLGWDTFSGGSVMCNTSEILAAMKEYGASLQPKEAEPTGEVELQAREKESAFLNEKINEKEAELQQARQEIENWRESNNVNYERWKEEMYKNRELKEQLKDREVERMKWVNVDQEPEFGGEYNVLYDLSDGGNPVVSTMDFDKNEHKWFDTRGANIECTTVLKWMPLPASPSIGSTTQAEDGLKNFIKSQKYPSGEEMDVLNKTFSRLRSDKPTRLKEEDVEKMEGNLIESLNKWIVGCEKMGYDIDFIETRLVNICSDHQLNLSR
jgi:hypothetical protein